MIKATNIVWHDAAVTATERQQKLGNKPCVLWYTGLSGSGKSTIANAVDRMLHDRGYSTYLLDGDNVRHGLNKDLGFTDVDRIENIRRIAEVSRLFNDAGLIVSTAFISPFTTDRDSARALVGADFIEIFIDTPLAECEKRDPKGMYKKLGRVK
nr:adenylyl-sulfate kinase [Psychrobacter sp. WY6]